MVALFISYSSDDEAAARRLGDHLAGHGLPALFLAADARRGIPGGRSWERELYAQLRRADAVVLLATAAAVASRWCFAEVCLGRSLGKPVLPLRLEPGVALDLLADVQWIDAEDAEAAVPDLLHALRSAGLDPRGAVDWDPRRAPYPGLEAFGRADAGVFFGRDQEIAELEELLQPILRRRPGRCVGIIGPSGSGKSSLLHAGLLPRLRRDDRWLVVPPLVPGPQPITQLARSLAEATAEAGRPRRAADIRRELSAGPDALVELVQELGGTEAPARDVLLVVDQAEELTTLAGPAEQREFLDLLHAALERQERLWVVLAARSEFLVSDPGRAGLAELVRGVVVEPLSRHRLPEVIRRPAQRAGIDLAPALVDQMVRDASGGDALPLLAYTLRALHDARRRPDRITAADYVAVGGVVGALRGRADRIVRELTAAGHGEHVLPALVRLVSVDRDGEPARRRVPTDQLDDDSAVVVEAFLEARLLIARADPAGRVTVEVAHEALLRQWDPLRDAIESSRTSLRTRSELERLTADWERGGQDESYLLHGARLAEVEDWAQRHLPEAHPSARRYLEASRTVAGRELDRARRSNRRLRLLATALSLLVAVAVGATLLATMQYRAAQAEARTNFARQLAAQSDEVVDGDPETAILLGLQSLDVGRDADLPPPTGLVTALARRTHASRQLTGHRAEVSSVATAPDGTVASAARDGTVRLWTSAGEPAGPPLQAGTGELSGVAFSADGHYLAAAGEDGAIRLWELPGLRELPALQGHKGPAYGIAFSRDGRLLATAGDDGTIRLWDLPSFTPHAAPPAEHEDAVYRVAFSADSRLLASASWDHTVRIWDVRNGKPVGAPLQHPDEVQSVAFSPDGRLLASGGVDHRVRIWDVATHRELGAPMDGGGGEKNGVAFDLDGRVLASSSTDGAVQLWDVATHQPLGPPLTGHTGAVRDAAFTPDGASLVTASWDATVRIWRLADTPTLSRALTGHTGQVNDVAWQPGGELVATASGDGTALLWDRRSGRPVGPPLTGHEGDVYSVAFSPDGRLLATGGLDTTVRLWDVPTRTPRGPPLTGNESWIDDLAFSPDGTLLAAAGDDGTVRLWDVASGKPRGDPLTANTQSVLAVRFSPDGRLIATAGVDRTVRLWSSATGLPAGEPLLGPTDWVTSLSFAPDGASLAAGSRDRAVRIWDTWTHAPVGEPVKTPGEVTAVAFDGHRLASAGPDRAVRFWDPATGAPVGYPLTGHTDRITAVELDPATGELATASDDGTARLWDPGFADWAGRGCELVGRNLSAEDWRRFLEDRPYERTCPALPSGPDAPAAAPAADAGPSS